MAPLRGASGGTLKACPLTRLLLPFREHVFRTSYYLRVAPGAYEWLPFGEHPGAR